MELEYRKAYRDMTSWCPQVVFHKVTAFQSIIHEIFLELYFLCKCNKIDSFHKLKFSKKEGHLNYFCAQILTDPQNVLIPVFYLVKQIGVRYIAMLTVKFTAFQWAKSTDYCRSKQMKSGVNSVFIQIRTDFKLTFSWFAGRITRNLAEIIVQRNNLPRGSFLIRERLIDRNGEKSALVFISYYKIVAAEHGIMKK